MGLELKNPLVVSSSGLTNTIQGIERSFRAGAAAVVLKSLFEEQIDAELRSDETPPEELTIHPEADDYLERMGKELGPTDYLSLIKEAKRRFDDPIIASVNCVSSKWWADWARQIEDAGADALELNIAIMPRGSDQLSSQIEDRFVSIVDRVKRNVDLPISVKLGPYFTALPQLVGRLQKAGVRGLVLFNRFYQLDIDIKEMKLVPGYQFSSAGEIYPTIRWTSLLSGQCGCDIAASTGVENGGEVVKLLLAGAHAVQICSTLYRNGYEHITDILEELGKWMETSGFASVADFRGRLSQNASDQPANYERLQYIKALTGIG